MWGFNFILFETTDKTANLKSEVYIHIHWSRYPESVKTNCDLAHRINLYESLLPSTSFISSLRITGVKVHLIYHCCNRKFGESRKLLW